MYLQSIAARKQQKLDIDIAWKKATQVIPDYAVVNIICVGKTGI